MTINTKIKELIADLRRFHGESVGTERHESLLEISDDLTTLGILCFYVVATTNHSRGWRTGYLTKEIGREESFPGMDELRKQLKQVYNIKEDK